VELATRGYHDAATTTLTEKGEGESGRTACAGRRPFTTITSRSKTQLSTESTDLSANIPSLIDVRLAIRDITTQNRLPAIPDPHCLFRFSGVGRLVVIGIAFDVGFWVLCLGSIGTSKNNTCITPPALGRALCARRPFLVFVPPQGGAGKSLSLVTGSNLIR
jgi:hypothetical protein